MGSGRQPCLVRQDEAGIQPVVSDQLRQRLAGRPEDEVMQFDDGKRGRDLTVIAHPQRHFPFDRQVGEGSHIEGVTRPANLAFVQITANRACHPELRDGARSGAADLVADDAIARRDP